MSMLASICRNEQTPQPRPPDQNTNNPRVFRSLNTSVEWRNRAKYFFTHTTITKLVSEEGCPIRDLRFTPERKA